MSVEKYGCAIQKSLFAYTNQDSIFSHTRNNSKMSSITWKYFRFFNNKPPAGGVAHVAKDFPTCYSCSYYSSMFRHIEERLRDKFLCSYLKFRVWKYDMTYASDETVFEEIGNYTNKLAYIFHDVNSILYTAYPMLCFYWRFSVVET